MSATMDVQLSASHPWSSEWLPYLVGRQWQIECTVDDSISQRPATVIGAVRLPPDVGGIVVKIEIP